MDVHPLGPRLRDRVGVGVLHVQADGVDLEEEPLAQPGAAQRQVCIGDFGLVIELDARDFRGPRREN